MILRILSCFVLSFGILWGSVKPESKYWAYDVPSGETRLRANFEPEDDKGLGTIVARSMRPQDDAAVIQILSNPDVRHWFASLPNPQDLPDRCENFYRAKLKTTPPQAAIVFEIQEEGNPKVIAMARLGQQSEGASVPALLVHPHYWRRGLAKNLLRSPVIAGVLAEIHMIGSGQMGVPGTPKDMDIAKAFQFFHEPLVKHAATIHPENPGFPVLSEGGIASAPHDMGLPLVQLEKDGWVGNLRSKFDSGVLIKDQKYPVAVGKQLYTVSYITTMHGQAFHDLRVHFEDTVDAAIFRSGLNFSLNDYIQSILTENTTPF